jgi:NAD(P)H-hydrate repair Nnr-like enzyme with NAD(P)H-hydrate dehydratase domain
VINPTGNARLATAGTGDVLAGMVGAALASGIDAFNGTGHAVYQHGLIADHWSSTQALVAGKLARFQYR